jgi:Uma2 family endonuclease
MNLIPAELSEDGPELENGLEWIDGQIVEKPGMGAESSIVTGKLFRRLGDYAETKNLGHVFPPDVGYRIAVGSSRRVRKPDVSFVARGRFPDDRVPRGNITLAPDLAAEVISPNDLAEDIEQRIADFFSVETRLFWVIYPTTRSAWVLRRDGSALRLTGERELSGEDVIPGFSCALADLFAGI